MGSDALLHVYIYSESHRYHGNVTSIRLRQVEKKIRSDFLDYGMLDIGNLYPLSKIGRL